MSEQNASAPAQTPALASLGDRHVSRASLTNDLFAEIEGMPEERPAARAKVPAKAPAKQPAQEPEEGEEPSEEDGEEYAAQGEEEAEEEPAEEEAEASEAFRVDGRGTKDKPLTVQDLPTDSYVKIKVDGQPETVSLRELTDGYIRQTTFDRSLSKSKHALAEAQRLGESFKAEKAKFREEFRGFVSDPSAMFEFLMDHQPEALEQLSRKFANTYTQWQADPETKIAWMRDRMQRREAEVESRATRAREAEQAERAQTQQAEEIRQRLLPGYQAGMREAGFPKFNEEMKDMVNALVAQAKRRNGEVGPDDVRKAIVHAAKVLDAPKGKAPAAAAEDRPAPAPKPKRKVAEPQVEQRKRHPRDPDAWLEGIAFRR